MAKREKIAKLTGEKKIQTSKKPYKKPSVVDFGHISALTAGTAGSFLDEGHLANQHGH